jgi:hypothetical protein
VDSCGLRTDWWAGQSVIDEGPAAARCAFVLVDAVPHCTKVSQQTVEMGHFQRFGPGFGISAKALKAEVDEADESLRQSAKTRIYDHAWP